jgi:vacuolar-type H+-ATPase subunit E/Vma4
MSAAVEEMLQLVESHERARCRDAAERAQKETKQIVTEAHRTARARMHETTRELRELGRRRLALAHAELETARRGYERRCDLALIEQGWELLRERLRGRWQDAASRAQWVEGLATQALAALPRGEWTVVHPPGWPAAEQKQLVQRLAQASIKAPQFKAEPAVSAGLRLCVQGACLDGTLEGLLADRAAVQAMMLAELSV